MRPALRLFRLLLLWTIFGIAIALWPAWLMPWLAIGAALWIAAVMDAMALRRLKTPTLHRNIPGRFALNTDGMVRLEIRHTNTQTLHVNIHDGLPDHAVTSALPTHLAIAPGRTAIVEYPLRFFRRGTVHFHVVHLLLRSPWGLWNDHRTPACPSLVRIYPNYEPVIRYAVLSRGHQVSQMGVVKRRLAGVSREFHQLREYREGDLMQQVDWKATSRVRQLISREYRDQRDQNIVFLIDDGRRMRTLDGELSQFDHALNATMLLSYVATRQGDSVSFFTPSAGRYLPPVRGPRAMATLLNHLYDLEPSLSPCDYHEAARRIMIQQKRHALVVILTNLRSEDTDELVPAISLLRSRHAVLVASIRERSVEQCLQAEPDSLESALTWHAAVGYRASRDETFLRLQARGVHVVDAQATDLPVELANAYDRLKKAGLM